MYISILARTLCGLALIAWISGCASMSAQKITLDQDGNITNLKKVRGLPITVQQPTHALFLVQETTTATFALVATDSTPAADDDDGPQGSPAGTVAGTLYVRGERIGEPRTTRTLLNETPVLIGRAQMFALDVKRPASGTIDYEIDLQNQYPTKVHGIVTDNTLKDAVDGLVKLAQQARSFMTLPAPGEDEKQGAGLTEDVVVGSDVVFLVMDLANPTEYEIVRPN